MQALGSLLQAAYLWASNHMELLLYLQKALPLLASPRATIQIWAIPLLGPSVQFLAASQQAQTLLHTLISTQTLFQVDTVKAHQVKDTRGQQELLATFWVSYGLLQQPP